MLSANSPKLRPAMKKQILTVAICLSIVFCSIAAVAENKRSENFLNALFGGNAKNEHLFVPMAAAAANFDQCANGGVGDPPEQCTGANWVNGNVNQSKAHWVEGQSVVFRQTLTGFILGATGNAVTIGWDTTKGGKHAYDYLTSFDRTETLAMGNNPCSGISGCNLGTFTTAPIPIDPNVEAGHDQIPGNGDDITQIPGVFTLFGGTITNVSGYTVTGSYAGDSHTSITITFTADSENMVLAWGGHIGKRLDWGPSNTTLFNGAGSPYHMSQDSCSFGCTAAGRSLAAIAVSTLDAPINNVPSTQSTNQNTPLTFSSGNGNEISVTDPDDADDGTSGNQNVQVELSVTNGTMTLSSVAGISFSFADLNGTGAGDGTADALMRFRGTINNVNAALNGMTFTPTAGFSGSANLQIITNDLGSSGDFVPLTDTDAVTIIVGNRPPVADDDTYSVAEDGTLTVLFGNGVLIGDTDPDNDPLAVGSPVGPSNGSLTLNADGSFTYDPNANFNGQDSFTYVVSDGRGGTDTGQVTITVTSVNDPPTVEVVRGGSCAGSGNGGTMNLLVSDLESSAASLSLGKASSNAALVPTGNVTFGGSGANRTVSITAIPQKSAQNSVITITVSDGDGGSSQVTITVFVGTSKKETINGSSGADLILGLNGDDTVNANAGNDLVCGGNGSGTVNGGDGDDTIDGGSGNDVLRGGGGRDILIGGLGSDRLEGGDDDDTLTGGSGGDRFIGGAGTDVATDFNAGQGDTTDGSIP